MLTSIGNNLCLTSFLWILSDISNSNCSETTHGVGNHVVWETIPEVGLELFTGTRFFIRRINETLSCPAFDISTGLFKDNGHDTPTRNIDSVELVRVGHFLNLR